MGMKEEQLESLDLNLLLALHWLLSERNVSSAAQKLNVTQPAASRALSKLRDIFHDPLLVKSGRQMAATPRAEELQPVIADAIERLRTVVRHNHEFDPEQQSGSITISCVDYLASRVAQAWAKVIAPHAPKLDLQLANMSVDSASDLISGKIDFTLVPDYILTKLPPTIDVDQFVRREVFRQQFFTCVRKGHPLDGKKMTLKRFTDYDHILINPEGPGLTGMKGGDIGMVDIALREQDLRRRIAYRTHSFLSAVQIVKKTDCILTAMSGVLESDHKGLVFFEPPIPMPEFVFYAGWHPNWTPDPRHKWVRERLLPALANVPSPDFLSL